MLHVCKWVMESYVWFPDAPSARGHQSPSVRRQANSFECKVPWSNFDLNCNLAFQPQRMLPRLRTEVLPAAKLEPAAVSRIRDTIVSESWERHASVDCPMIWKHAACSMLGNHIEGFYHQSPAPASWDIILVWSAGLGSVCEPHQTRSLPGQKIDGPLSAPSSCQYTEYYPMDSYTGSVVAQHTTNWTECCITTGYRGPSIWKKSLQQRPILKPGKKHSFLQGTLNCRHSHHLLASWSVQMYDLIYSNMAEWCRMCQSLVGLHLFHQIWQGGVCSFRSGRPSQNKRFARYLGPEPADKSSRICTGYEACETMALVGASALTIKWSLEHHQAPFNILDP